MRAVALLLLTAAAQGCTQGTVKQRAELESLHSLELALEVEAEGTLRAEAGTETREGRLIRVTAGEQILRFDPTEQYAESVREYLRQGIESGLLVPASTNITLTAREGVKYMDVILPLDALVELGFEKVSFAGDT